MTTNKSELAIWAEGTKYTTEELVGMYEDYVTTETEEGCEPLSEAAWAEQVLVLSVE